MFDGIGTLIDSFDIYHHVRFISHVSFIIIFLSLTPHHTHIWVNCAFSSYLNAANVRSFFFGFYITKGYAIWFIFVLMRWKCWFPGINQLHMGMCAHITISIKKIIFFLSKFMLKVKGRMRKRILFDSSKEETKT